MKTGWSAPRFPAGGAPEAHPLETLALRLLGGLLAAGVLLWLTGELSGRLFGGELAADGAVRDGAVVSRTRITSEIPAQAGPKARATCCPVQSPSTGRSRRSLLPAAWPPCCSRMRRATEGPARAGAHAGRARATFARCARTDTNPVA